LRGNLWQRCLGMKPGLEVQIHFLPQRRVVALTEVNVAMRPYGCGREQADLILKESAPNVLESLRNFLQVYPEQRRGQRVKWERKVSVCQIPTICRRRASSRDWARTSRREEWVFFCPARPRLSRPTFTSRRPSWRC
jgi:hypothetical protein